MERKQQRTNGSSARSKPNILIARKRHSNSSNQEQESINKENLTQVTNKRAKYVQQSINQHFQQVPGSHNLGNHGSSGLNPHTGSPSIESHSFSGEQHANGNSLQTFIVNLGNRGSSELMPLTKSPLIASHSFSGKQHTSINSEKKIHSSSMQSLPSGFIAKGGGLYGTANQKTLPLYPKKSVPKNSKPAPTVTSDILLNAKNALPVVPPPINFLQEDLYTLNDTGKRIVPKKTKPTSTVTTNVLSNLMNQDQTNTLPVVPPSTNFLQDDLLYTSNDIGKHFDINNLPIFYENPDSGELSAVAPALLDGDEEDLMSIYLFFIIYFQLWGKQRELRAITRLCWRHRLKTDFSALVLQTRKQVTNDRHLLCFRTADLQLSHKIILLFQCLHLEKVKEKETPQMKSKEEEVLKMKTWSNMKKKMRNRRNHRRKLCLHKIICSKITQKSKNCRNKRLCSNSKNLLHINYLTETELMELLIMMIIANKNRIGNVDEITIAYHNLNRMLFSLSYDFATYTGGNRNLRSRSDNEHRDNVRNNGNVRLEEPVYHRLQMLTSI